MKNSSAVPVSVLVVTFLVFCLSATNHHSDEEIKKIMNTLGYKDYKILKDQSFFNFLYCNNSKQKATKIILNNKRAVICSGHFSGGAVVNSI